MPGLSGDDEATKFKVFQYMHEHILYILMDGIEMDRHSVDRLQQRSQLNEQANNAKDVQELLSLLPKVLEFRGL